MEDKLELLKLFNENRDWEKRAEEGIEKNRKGNLKITLKNKNGETVQNAAMSLKQKSHEFRFGANLFLLDELETEEKNRIYKEKFAEVFNMATLPFYWNATEPEKGKLRYEEGCEKMYRRPSTDLCVKFCEEKGIEPREHALAFPSHFPQWVIPLSTEEAKAELERRYKEISERYADKIPTIEVTNEMFWDKANTSFYDEPDYVEWCFKKAEEYFPNNQLVINEATPFTFGENARVTDKYYMCIENALLKGARIDAIGMQCHHFTKLDAIDKVRRDYYDPESIYKHLDLYARFGKPLQITEVTVSAFSGEKDAEEVQAKLLENVYKIWFSHPNVEQIIYWNTVDGYAYLQDPNPEKIKASQGDMSLGENVFYGALLHFDMSEKPAFKKLKDLINNVWHTEASLKTDKNGVAQMRGFYGDYELSVTVNGKTVNQNITLSSKKENEIEIIV